MQLTREDAQIVEKIERLYADSHNFYAVCSAIRQETGGNKVLVKTIVLQVLFLPYLIVAKSWIKQHPRVDSGDIAAMLESRGFSAGEVELYECGRYVARLADENRLDEIDARDCPAAGAGRPRSVQRIVADTAAAGGTAADAVFSAQCAHPATPKAEIKALFGSLSGAKPRRPRVARPAPATPGASYVDFYAAVSAATDAIEAKKINVAVDAARAAGNFALAEATAVAPAEGAEGRERKLRNLGYVFTDACESVGERAGGILKARVAIEAYNEVIAGKKPVAAAPVAEKALLTPHELFEKIVPGTRPSSDYTIDRDGQHHLLPDVHLWYDLTKTNQLTVAAVNKILDKIGLYVDDSGIPGDAQEGRRFVRQMWLCEHRTKTRIGPHKTMEKLLTDSEVQQFILGCISGGAVAPAVSQNVAGPFLFEGETLRIRGLGPDSGFNTSDSLTRGKQRWQLEHYDAGRDMWIADGRCILPNDAGVDAAIKQFGFTPAQIKSLSASALPLSPEERAKEEQVVREMLGEELVGGVYKPKAEKRAWRVDGNGYPRVDIYNANAMMVRGVELQEGVAKLHKHLVEDHADLAWQKALKLPKKPTIAQIEEAVSAFIVASAQIYYNVGITPEPNYGSYFFVVPNTRAGDKLKWVYFTGPLTYSSAEFDTREVIRQATDSGKRGFQIRELYMTERYEDRQGYGGSGYGFICRADYEAPDEVVSVETKRKGTSRVGKDALIAVFTAAGWVHSEGAANEYLTHSKGHVRLQIKARNARFQYKCGPGQPWHDTALGGVSAIDPEKTLQWAEIEAKRYAAPLEIPISARKAVELGAPSGPAVFAQEAWINGYTYAHHGKPRKVPNDYSGFRDSEWLAGYDKRMASQSENVTIGAIEIEHTVDGGTLAKGDTKPVKDILKEFGFRWSASCGFWYVPRTRGLAESSVSLDAVRAAIEKVKG